MMASIIPHTHNSLLGRRTMSATKFSDVTLARMAKFGMKKVESLHKLQKSSDNLALAEATF
jgi:hypothetical protein